MLRPFNQPFAAYRPVSGTGAGAFPGAGGAAVAEGGVVPVAEAAAVARAAEAAAAEAVAEVIIFCFFRNRFLALAVSCLDAAPEVEGEALIAWRKARWRMSSGAIEPLHSALKWSNVTVAPLWCSGKRRVRLEGSTEAEDEAVAEEAEGAGEAEGEGTATDGEAAVAEVAEAEVAVGAVWYAAKPSIAVL
jgi:hypothetical protein